MINPCVLDTSVASLLLNNSPLLPPYKSHIIHATLVLRFQSVAEMRYGARLASWGAERRYRLEQFIEDTEVIQSSDALATQWSEVMHEARRVGRRLEVGDAWIAATAALLGAPLLTHDKDFAAEACPSIIVHCYASAEPLI